MSKDLFQDIPAEQRAQHLQDNCYKIEETKLKRAYNKEELSNFKDKLSDEMIVLNDLQGELDEIKKDFKNKMAPGQAEVKKLLRSLRNKYEEVKGKVYLVADYVDDTMTYYDEFGKFIESRKLMPHEKQTNMLNINSEKTGTNG